MRLNLADIAPDKCVLSPFPAHAMPLHPVSRACVLEIAQKSALILVRSVIVALFLGVYLTLQPYRALRGCHSAVLLATLSLFALTPDVAHATEH